MKKGPRKFGGPDMKILADIGALILGIVLYGFMADTPVHEISAHIYFCAVGYGFAALKYKVWRV